MLRLAYPPGGDNLDSLIPQALVVVDSRQSGPPSCTLPRIEELVSAVARGALRDSAVSLLSPTQDHINDLRPPGERYK